MTDRFPYVFMCIQGEQPEDVVLMIEDYVLSPVLQRVDINRNLFAIDINHNYVHKRQGTADLRLIGGLTIDLDRS